MSYSETIREMLFKATGTSDMVALKKYTRKLRFHTKILETLVFNKVRNGVIRRSSMFHREYNIEFKKGTLLFKTVLFNMKQTKLVLEHKLGSTFKVLVKYHPRRFDNKNNILVEKAYVSIRIKWEINNTIVKERFK